jgi:hypothetical protein
LTDKLRGRSGRGSSAVRTQLGAFLRTPQGRRALATSGLSAEQLAALAGQASDLGNTRGRDGDGPRGTGNAGGEGTGPGTGAGTGTGTGNGGKGKGNGGKGKGGKPAPKPPRAPALLGLPVAAGRPGCVRRGPA